MRFFDALRTDDATCGWNELSIEESELFDSGITALTSATASALAEAYDFSRHTFLLDLGGGTGAFLLAIVKKYPQLRATLFERPQMQGKMRRPGIRFISGRSVPRSHA